MAHQLIAAEANIGYLETGIAQNKFTFDLTKVIAALDGTDIAQMNLFASQLDGFNCSGDNVAFPLGKSEGKADPGAAKKLQTDTGLAFK